MKIMQLNLNHCAAAQDLLLESIRENEVDVCVLSEPFRPGFGADWTCDHTGKAAIWVCGRNPQQFGHQQADGGFVRALVGSVWVYSVYLAPSLSISDFANTLDRLAADVRDHSPAFVAGDFNAWAGTQLTFCRAGVGSIVDLTYVCSALSSSARWRLSDAYTASDHRAILCEVGGRRPSNTSDPSRWVNFKADKMDVLRFSARIQCMEAAGSAVQMATIALHALAQACKDTMPPRRSSTHHHLPVYWWNEDIATARRECNRVRRCYQRSRGRPSYTSWQREFKERRKALKH
ncbi:hypothetical protein KR215_008557, partial [Drosophila sulfurigaster]